MDITYVYHTDYSPEVAHGKQIVHTCNELIKRGHTLTVVTAGDIYHFAKENNLAIEFDVIRRPLSLPGLRADQVSYFLTSIWVARTSDVLYTRDIRFLKFLKLFPVFQRWLPPIVYEAHKVYHQLESMSNKQEHSYVDLASTVITNSEGVKSDLESIGISVEKVVPNAANLDLVPNESKDELRKKLGMNLSATIVVYAGSFDTDKNNLELLIEGVDRVGNNYDIELLLLGGSNPELEDIQIAAQSADMVNDKITFLGRIPHNQVFPYLKASDIGVIPLNPTTTEFDKYTSPIKLYEYLVSGLKVLAADVYAIEKATDDVLSVSTYETGSVDSFADSLEILISSKKDSKTNSILSEKFSYKNRAREVEYVLQKAIET